MQTPEIAKQKYRLVWWPSPQDYNEAVQTPPSSYSDEDLRVGQVELTALGLPRPQTGNFASVYRVDCVNRCWAVRCFLRNIPDQQMRYRHIESALEALSLPFFVPFAYVAEGVRLHGDWFPILKMEWVEGLTLIEYIQANLHEPGKMRQLAEDLKQLTSDMRLHGIAHGDLQHGNIIVTDAGLRLVDYDGLYVPGLAGKPASELGHPNYQHPARKPTDFNLELDNFSAWVIYASLMILHEDPSLFEQLDVGDDCLLFRQQDFIQPTRSRAFALLERHRSESIRKLARWIRGLLMLPVEQVPDLSAEVIEPAGLTELQPHGGQTDGNPSQQRIPVETWSMILVVMLCLSMLAIWSADMAKRETATIENKVKKMSVAALPPQDRDLISQADEFARVGRASPDTNTQISYLQKALDIYERYPDCRTEVIVDCAHDIGHDYKDLDKYAEAREYFEKALNYLGTMGPIDTSRGSLYSRLNGDISWVTERQKALSQMRGGN